MRGFKDHFSGHGPEYAAHRPQYPAALASYFARLTPRRELAWDCGCGSGQFSRLLAPVFERVIATDASQDQIAAAPPHPKVEYYCALADASSLPNQRIDLIVAAQAAHWFPLRGFYREVKRVGRSGSIIGLITYQLPVVNSSVDAIISSFYSQTLRPYWAPERRFVEDGYRSIPFPFDEIAPPRFEMSVEWSLPDLVGYINTWSAVWTLEKDQGRGPVEQFEEQLSRVWGSPKAIRRVRWPLSLRVGYVRS